jgi:site-specific DNA-methyltransferase (adenine-specific)
MHQGTFDLREGDALDVLRSLPDSSVNLVVTDPPYFKVKAEWWDRQWEKPAGFLAWMGQLVDEWRRVLKPNGSLYVFASREVPLNPRRQKSTCLLATTRATSTKS